MRKIEIPIAETPWGYRSVTMWVPETIEEYFARLLWWAIPPQRGLVRYTLRDGQRVWFELHALEPRGSHEMYFRRREQEIEEAEEASESDWPWGR